MQARRQRLAPRRGGWEKYHCAAPGRLWAHSGAPQPRRSAPVAQPRRAIPRRAASRRFPQASRSAALSSPFLVRPSPPVARHGQSPAWKQSRFRSQRSGWLMVTAPVGRAVAPPRHDTPSSMSSSQSLSGGSTVNPYSSFTASTRPANQHRLCSGRHPVEVVPENWTGG